MMSVPHTSSPRRCFPTSTGETLQPWDGGTQPVDQFCIKQEPSDEADTDGQDSPLASWHRQTLPRPQSHRKSNFQTVNQSRAFSSHEIAQPSLSAATSDSRHSAGDDTQPKDGDSSSSASDEDEDADGGEMNPQAAAERQAEQRKMKRFRLTHNQTRYLMSEYARQAHPGSAQRERLAREIPGLSPRQVQVWFQNRRAKLKRLSADDRESILKSRALPLDFDTTQALHYMHDTPSQVDATAIVHHNHDGYDAATLSRPPSSGMSPQEPFSLYPQQDFLRRAILPNVPLDHDEPLDSLKHRVTGYYPYNRSHLINTAAYARRASGSVLLGGQDVSPVTMPVRPIQSAPLAKPPDSLTAQQSLQKQLIDGGPRSGSFYEQRPQNSNFWGPCTMSSDCQPEYTGHISDPPHFHPPPNGRHDASGEQETFEGWNG
ncbi:MAG: hypothetical protein Q9196_006074 [Gyalolechia fulgens]